MSMTFVYICKIIRCTSIHDIVCSMCIDLYVDKHLVYTTCEDTTNVSYLSNISNATNAPNISNTNATNVSYVPSTTNVSYVSNISNTNATITTNVPNISNATIYTLRSSPSPSIKLTTQGTDSTLAMPSTMPMTNTTTTPSSNISSNIRTDVVEQDTTLIIVLSTLTPLLLTLMAWVYYRWKMKHLKVLPVSCKSKSVRKPETPVMVQSPLSVTFNER